MLSLVTSVKQRSANALLSSTYRSVNLPPVTYKPQLLAGHNVSHEFPNE